MYQGRKTAKGNDGNFVLRCGQSVSFSCEGVQERTVYGQVSKRRTRRALDLYVGILEKEEDGLQSVSIDLADIYEGQSATSAKAYSAQDTYLFL